MKKAIKTSLAVAISAFGLTVSSITNAAEAGYWWGGGYYPTCYWDYWGNYFCY